MKPEAIVLAGSNQHKENFIKELNKSGFTPKFADIKHIMEEGDYIVCEERGKFYLTNDIPDGIMLYELPYSWDVAIEEMRNV